MMRAPGKAAIRLVEAFNSQGNAHTASERFPEAEAAFRAALGVDPHCGPVWNNLGNLLRVQGRADESLEAYHQAIACNSRLAPAYSNLGNALRDRGQLPKAIAALRRAVELDPSSAVVHSNLVYAACFDPDHDAAAILQEARAWADRHEAPLRSTHQPHSNNPDPNRRLRIGYVSPDFREHVIGRNVLPVLEHHDRHRFDIHCFSTLHRHDSATSAFIAAADRWHECARLTDAEMAGLIRSLQIDILIDLTLHISGNRLLTFARKPAPVQITWAGYPGTTGLSAMDYRITDSFLDPPGTDLFYSERSIRLSDSFWCYRPMVTAPEVTPLPALSSGRITFGCLNNSAKVSHLALLLWAQVLAAVPRSRLLMLCAQGSLRGDIMQELRSNSIDPDRISFVEPVKPSDHLVRYHPVDISLDPLPYTGHTSTLDSLWMGVPVITLSGQTCAARGSVTALSNIGLTKLIALTSRDYIRAAAELALDIKCLSQLRQSLRHRMKGSPLCDEARFTAELEEVYRRVWQDWVARSGATRPA